MSKTIRLFLAASALSAGVFLPWSGYAQTSSNHQHAHAAAQPAMVDGEVKKVDPANGKVTIRHADIPHLDMPAMTMVFTAKDKAMLAHVKPGDKVRFLVVQEGGRLLLTEIQTRP